MISLLILLLSFQTPVALSYATEDFYYARIMQEDVVLYKNPVENNDFSNVYFTLPETYFVKLISSANTDFYQVEYSSFTGYVKKECVQTIQGTPITPYLENINFRVYAELSRDMRTSPTTVSGLSSQITYIPLMSRNLTYYGKIEGECLISGRTNVWYYCKYTADKDYYGYVYSDFCDEETKILPNTEEVVYIDEPIFEKVETPEIAIPIDSDATGVIIAILSVPAVIFAFMIIKNKKITKSERTISREIIDY